MVKGKMAWGGWKTRITRQGWLCQALGKMAALARWVGQGPTLLLMSKRRLNLHLEQFEQRLTPSHTLIDGTLLPNLANQDINTQSVGFQALDASPGNGNPDGEAIEGFELNHWRELAADGPELGGAPQGTNPDALASRPDWADWRLGGAELVHGASGIVVATRVALGAVVPVSADAAANRLFFNNQPSGGEVVFVSAELADRVPVAWGKSAEVVVLDPHGDAIRQITDSLISRKNLIAIHIVSHGSAGTLWLGNQRLDQKSLEARSTEVRGWAEALAPGADLLLYGCDVTATDQGRAFVNELAAFTGADVAASSDITGAAALGGGARDVEILGD